MSIKAFPTAVGGGTFSRADVVYTHRIVTNLNDEGTGSLRWAMQPNSIVSFNVSGLSQNINTTYSGLQNVIVLGQTAPAGGYEYGGPGIRADYVNNFIMRFVSLRNTWFGRDALDFIGCKDVIVDHCSVSFGGDETMSFRASYADSVVERITNSNNHFNFSKTGMLLGDSDDTSRNVDLSSIGNLWSVMSHRFPNVNIDGRCDAIGNVVYDWANRIMVTEGNLQLNEINNSYIAPSGNGSRNQARANTVGTPTVTTSPTIYSAGNLHTGIGITSTDDQWGTGYLVQGQYRPEPVVTTEGLWQNRVVSYTASTFEHDVFPLDGYSHPEYRTNTMFPLINFLEADLQSAAWWQNKIITERNVGNCARIDSNGNKVQQIQSIDASSFDRIDNNTIFPWTSALDYKIIPELVEYFDTTYPTTAGVIVNTHDAGTHNQTVTNAWIIANGLTVETFDAMGHDLDLTYTNIEIYSFEIDGGFVPPVTVDVTSVSIAPATADVEVNKAVSINATVLPSDATNKTGVWTSDAPLIASVNNTGLVGGLSEGTATITFTCNDTTLGTFTDTTVITVIPEVIIPVTSVVVTPSTASVAVGSTTLLNVQVLPAEAQDKTGIWTSDTLNATIDFPENEDGIVTGVTEGVSTVTFTSNDGGFADTSIITVTSEISTGLILNGTFNDDLNLTLERGWSLVENELYFDDGQDNTDATFVTSLDLITGEDYELSFDITNGNANRFSIVIDNVVVVPTTFYPTSLGQTVTFTNTSSTLPAITVRASNSAGATAFYLDNVSLTRVGVVEDPIIPLTEGEKAKNKSTKIRAVKRKNI